MSEWIAAFTPSMGWIVRGCKVKPVTSSHGFVCGLNEEDAKLIAEAPKLLAEVEHSRALLAHIARDEGITIVGYDGTRYGDEEE